MGTSGIAAFSSGALDTTQMSVHSPYQLDCDGFLRRQRCQLVCQFHTAKGRLVDHLGIPRASATWGTISHPGVLRTQWTTGSFAPPGSEDNLLHGCHASQ